MHLVYSFTVGGLENGVANLINRMDATRFRHMVVALTHCDPSFCRRIQRPDVRFLSLRKRPGNGYKLYPLLYRVFRKYRPDILHTRNLAALEAMIPAWAARVPVRIHGEHGWDNRDPGGTQPRFKRIRRLYRPFVHHFIALSGQIARYLEQGVGVRPAHLTRICNGVDTDRFYPLPHPASQTHTVPAGSPFTAPGLVVMGTVGRLQQVKDQLTLVQAFAAARRLFGAGVESLRLIMVGDGPLRGEVEAEIAAHGLGERVWLTGERADIPALMQSFDFFVLPSRAEGISNTILEAMASGLSVIATDVGGNAELVLEGETGTLVPPANPEAMAAALAQLTADAALREQQGAAARARAETEFSLDGMVENYSRLYQSLRV
jgi:sugar transferase (PEP-CTERM/EpsH1 system associated)